MSRFWSSFWTVAGFLFLTSLMQMLADRVFTLFGLLGLLAPTAAKLILAVSQAAVPIWTALTFVDWRWGWKADNAGLRRTPAALFWLFPGLLGGLLAALLAHLLTTQSLHPLPAPRLELVPLDLILLAITAVAAFTTELVFRGVVVSRFQADLAGKDLLILATAMPLVWAVARPLLVGFFGIEPYPSPAVDGIGTAVLSVFLTLLFLRTNSVWLAAGVRVGLEMSVGLLRLLPSEEALLLVFGIPAVILLLMEINRLRTLRRPGPRRGPKRVVYGKTIRGPWGPH